MNNYEKIKNMSVDEIAKILNTKRCDKCSESNCYESGVTCIKGIKQWLQQEAN